MKLIFISRSWIVSCFYAVGIIAFLTACQIAAGGENLQTGEKIQGISFVAANEIASAEDVTPVTNVGAAWVSLMPYGFVRRTEHTIHYNSDRQWIGETNKGIIATAGVCRQKGLKVMLKPQVWLRDGAYTGDYLPPDTSMIAFENSFEEFVLNYARLAQEIKADMYCIGTEWQIFIDHNPDFWHRLILKVKKIYHGPLTYAANWDEYKTTPFWPALDYIGVNAYFPLSDQNHPTLEDLSVGWQPWFEELKYMAESIAKPILFTEYGYRSTVKNASKPWESYTKPKISLKNQELAYEALYKRFWHQPWFAGGFAWKWFHNHEERGGEVNIGFTPQNKPAEALIRSYYSIPE
jgi:hypothetical protein